MRIYRFFVLLVLAVVLGPAAARALGPGGDVYFGYSHLGSRAFQAAAGGLNGWELAGHLKLMPYVGGEVDLAHYGAGGNSNVPHATTVLFGPRVTVGTGPVHLFMHGLVGWEHSANSSGSISSGALTAALGGGADFRIAPHFAWRVMADYIAAPTSSPSGASHNRIGTGLVFRF